MQLDELIFEFAEKHCLAAGTTNINGKGVAVLALPYTHSPAPLLAGLRGRISIAAVGTDYHKQIGEHLCQLAHACRAVFPRLESQAFADTGPLIERPLAVAAGLGFMGKNNLIHTKKFGSMVFLGYLILDIPLKQTKIQENTCGTCKRCIDACPTGALCENGFKKELCISFLTQKKGLLTPWEMQAMGKQIYGCDCCQLSCPHNVLSKPFAKNSEAQYPLLAQLLDIGKADFEKTLRSTAAGWQGRNAIRKNAVIAIGNSKHEQSVILLQKARLDPSPLIRETAEQILENYTKNGYIRS